MWFFYGCPYFSVKIDGSHDNIHDTDEYINAG